VMQSAVQAATIPTPLGVSYYLEASADAITFGEFRRTRAPAPRPRHPLLREAQAQVRAYFARKLRWFDLPLALEGTPLQCAAWRAVAQLPFGHFVSYAEVARAINRPRAHRGVAAAMAKTPIDLLIPAHRVLGSDGRIRGAAPRSIRARLVALERRTILYARRS
jgi:O-6-methylguanine DNA methyltransferase